MAEEATDEAFPCHAAPVDAFGRWIIAIGGEIDRRIARRVMSGAFRHVLGIRDQGASGKMRSVVGGLKPERPERQGAHSAIFDTLLTLTKPLS